ncbi:hypothetical protein LRP67_16210 [Nocardioides sp. cx-169]|uniref:hypothetical protein n=1 Tax=Nocardioides sp. cx-169 TaxID=2899080 RepID=UPI001E377899|nr:hypothetical protein [Nocardioides sp. cx-169]MCD4535637.1 hypothetical protein [Nocardioides sp. cx-169]
MQRDFAINVNNTALSFIRGAWWGEPVMTTRRRGGSWELTWRMDFKRGFRHPDLVRGATVTARIGSLIEWRGQLTEPDMDSMQFTAQGQCRQAETALALGFDGMTSNPSDAVFYAEARGLIDWGGLEVLSPVTSTGTTDHPMTIAELLDAYTLEHGTNWQVVPDWGLGTYADPTVPRWMVTPNTGVLGVADDDYWTNLVGTYLTTTGDYELVTSSDATPHVGRRERAVDLTALGRMTSARAQAALDAMLAKGLARTGWTNGIEIGRGQLFTMGGTPAAPSVVRGGHMVHLAGLADERGIAQFTNIIVDEAVWNVAEDTVQLNPVGLAPRDLPSIIESMGGKLV